MAIVKLNNENFEKEVLESRMPVLIDFWADWCGPCRMMSPVVDDIAESMNTSIKVGKVNIDECPELAEKYGVMSIPTFIVIKSGKVSGTIVGVQPRENLVKLLEV